MVGAAKEELVKKERPVRMTSEDVEIQNKDLSN